MPHRLPFYIGRNGSSLKRVAWSFFVSLAIAASSADASFKSFVPGGQGVVFPSSADGRATPTPSVQAYRLGDDEKIKLDGRLDDPAWEKAEAGSGFKVWEPDRGTIPTEETVFKIAYDE